MNTGQTVFSQLMDYLPLHTFRSCVKKYRGNYKVRAFSCFDQYLTMAFAQLTYRESLRDIEVCLRSFQNKLYHMGIRSRISRSTLADANEHRDWRIYADFTQRMIHRARSLYINDDFGVDLDNLVYALDATTIDLCLSLFPWAIFRKNKGGIKLHTLLDLRTQIPVFIRVTDALLHEVNVLDDILIEPGAFYIMDRAYLDFARLYAIHKASAFFVIRAKRNMIFQRLYSKPVDKTKGLICDQTIVLKIYRSANYYPEKMRRIRYNDIAKDQKFTFLTNNFDLPALTIADLHKYRWQIELFFKWIKQHLRIKSFYGTTPNAVKTQIWIAISVYILVAIIKKQLKIDMSLYSILQILSITLFEKRPIQQILNDFKEQPNKLKSDIQLNLFN